MAACASSTSLPPADSAGVTLYPPRIFLACLVVGAVFHIALAWPHLLPPGSWTPIPGLAVAAAGFAFMMWGHGRFRSLGINISTNLPAVQLVTKGAYRFSRNPMYVGFVSLLFGFGLAARSLPMMASALPMFFYLDWYVIAREERYLSRTFGHDYETYCRRVRRWL